MGHFLNRALVWLLFAALQVQGVAFAQVLRCSSGPTPALASAPHDSASHHHASSSTVHDEHHMAADAADHQSTPDHGVSKCNHCSPCCAGGTLLSTLPQLPLIPSSHLQPIAFDSTLFTSRIPDGLDRPPRAVLA